MKIVKFVLIFILLIVFLVSWVLLYRKSENEKFTNRLGNINPRELEKIITDMRNDGNYFKYSYDPEGIKGHHLPNKKIKKCEMLKVEDSYLENRNKIAYCMSNIPISVRTTNHNSKNIARSAPYMKNSEGGKAASNMKELDQDELDAMEKNM